MKSGIIAAVIIVLVVAGGVFVLTRKSTKTPSSTGNLPATTNTTNPTTQNDQSNSNTTPSSTDQSSGSTITYTDNGFSPTTLTVKTGTTVTVKNASSHLLQFDSDPHPAHTDDPEINVGTVSPGQSKTITVTKTGSHGYHNHLNPDDIGTLVVN